MSEIYLIPYSLPYFICVYVCMWGKYASNDLPLIISDKWQLESYFVCTCVLQ